MSLAQNEFGFEKEKFEDCEALLDLVSKAKTCLVNDMEGMIELIHRFGISSSYKEDRLASSALKLLNYTKDNQKIIEIEGYGKYAGRKFKKTVITFDDQIWLPLVYNLDLPKYDAIFVDEAQDLSKARRELVYKALAKDGRLFAIGDEHQAIYSFAGADINSLPTMVDELNCKPLTISCSWRCAKNIVKEAQNFNEIITYAPNASDGIVDRIDKKELVNNVKNGDVIISRTNAPLVVLFFQLSSQQKKVKFIGRDYGRMLSSRINKWKAIHESKGYGNFTGSSILDYNDEWLDLQRLAKKNTNMSRVKDEHATIIALTNGLNNSLDSYLSVKEILDRCNIFSPDENKNDDGTEYITLSSTHRFKGLERDHVYMLDWTYNYEGDQEELNLIYVAITRAKKHLTYVKKKMQDDDDL